MSLARITPKSLIPVLVALACLFGGASSVRAQTTTTYGTGGTINPGDTVILNNGASVTSDITANGTLQFNQSAGNTLTISNLISGTGTLTMSGGLVVVSGSLSNNAASTINLNTGGTLQIGLGGATGVLGVSTLTNPSPRSLTRAFCGIRDLTLGRASQGALPSGVSGPGWALLSVRPEPPGVAYGPTRHPCRRGNGEPARRPARARRGRGDSDIAKTCSH